MKSGRCADHREDIARVLTIGRVDGGDDLNVLIIRLGEERAAGAVDEPRGKDLGVTQLTLAFEEAAGDLSRGIGLLNIINRERHEVRARAGLLRADRGDEHDRLTRGDEDGAIGLFRDAPRLEGDGLIPYFNRFSN